MWYWVPVTTAAKNLIRCCIKELFDIKRLIISVFSGTIRVHRDSQGGSTEFSGQFPMHFRKVSTYIYLYNLKQQ